MNKKDKQSQSVDDMMGINQRRPWKSSNLEMDSLWKEVIKDWDSKPQDASSSVVLDGKYITASFLLQQVAQPLGSN